MDELVIREYYDEETLQCHQLNVHAFHCPNKDLDPADPEKALRFAVEADRKRQAQSIGDVKFRRVGAFYGDRLAANIFSVPFLMNFDGHTVAAGDVGDVCSEPELRRGGAVRKIFMKLHELMYEDGVVVGHLDPFIANFYRKFGYEAANERVFWAVPTEYLPQYSGTGIRRYVGTEEQKADIRKVFAGWMKGINMAPVLTEQQWQKWYDDHAPYVTDYYGYLHYGADGEPDGFFCYQTLYDGPQPMVVDCGTGAFWYTCPAGLMGILGYAAGMKDYARELRVCLPSSGDLTPVIEITGGWGRKLITRRTVINGTTRFINAQKALELAAYRGSGKVCIGLEDPTCPWNTGNWTVEFEDGKAVSVKKAGTPDIRLTEKAFGPLLLGRGGLARAEYHPGTEICGDRKELEKVFYEKTVFAQCHY